MSRIVTFYSYKGDVGRTFVLANIAVLLARRGLRVLIMDWDLEAPGLDRYFRDFLPEDSPPERGVLPMLIAASHSELADWNEHIVPITGLSEGGTLDLVSSGSTSAGYAADLQAFSWTEFFTSKRGGTILERWRDEWRKKYDFTLIDSRTGLSDSGGVCTILLPDILAAVFTTNHQSTSGALAVIEAAQAARSTLEVTRFPLTILPIPSRFDGRVEIDISDEWLNKFSELFSPVLESWLPNKVSARELFVKIKVPYVARFSFGEALPVETHGVSDPDLPGYSIAAVAELLANGFRNAANIVRGESIGETNDVSMSEFVVNGRFDLPAFDKYFRQLEIVNGRGPEQAEILHGAGVNLLKEARFSEAEPLMRRALVLEESFKGKNHADVAIHLNSLAMLLKATARPSEAEPLLRRAVRILDASYGREDPRVATCLNNLAQILHETNRLAEAEPLMRRVLKVNESHYGSDHPSVARALSNLAALLQATSRPAEAEPMMRRALSIDKKALGNDHIDVAVDLNNLASLLKASGRLSEAEPLMRQALAIDETALGSSHPNVSRDLNNLGQLLRIEKRYGEAESVMRRALAIDESVFGSDHPNVATRLNNLAGLLAETNRMSEVEPLLRRALAINELSLGVNHPSVAVSLLNLAHVYQAAKRLDEAEPLIRRHLEIFLQFSRDTGHPHPHLAEAVNYYGDLLIEMGATKPQTAERIRALVEPFGIFTPRPGA